MKPLKRIGLAALLAGSAVWPLRIPELVSSYTRGNVQTSLRSDIIANPTGWSSFDRKLEDEKNSESRYRDYLNYDDVLVRTYIRKDGQEQFTVYLGYWGPGKERVVGVGGHTPSACLQGRGGKLREIVPNQSYNLPDPLFREIEKTFFTFPDIPPMEVLFSHFVDGRRFSYKTPKLFRGQRRVENFARFGLNYRHEQYALRIMTHESFEYYSKDPGFQEVIKSIGDRVRQ